MLAIIRCSSKSRNQLPGHSRGLWPPLLGWNGGGASGAYANQTQRYIGANSLIISEACWNLLHFVDELRACLVVYTSTKSQMKWVIPILLIRNQQTWVDINAEHVSGSLTYCVFN